MTLKNDQLAKYPAPLRGDRALADAPSAHPRLKGKALEAMGDSYEPETKS